MPPRKRKVAPSESEGVTVTTGRTARKRRLPAKMLDAASDDELEDAVDAADELDTSSRAATRTRATTSQRVHKPRSARTAESSATHDDAVEDAAGTGTAVAAVDEAAQSEVSQHAAFVAQFAHRCWLDRRVQVSRRRDVAKGSVLVAATRTLASVSRA